MSARRSAGSIVLSVLKTLAWAVIGVALAILVLRFLPMDQMGIFVQEQPPFPASAALAGVGTLCGILPALAAVRVRPIDAIRY